MSWAVSTSGPAGAAARGQQVAVEVLDGQPLEVHDVGRAGGAAVAEHVGHVLGELDRRRARGSPGDPRPAR